MYLHMHVIPTIMTRRRQSLHTRLHIPAAPNIARPQQAPLPPSTHAAAGKRLPFATAIFQTMM